MSGSVIAWVSDFVWQVTSLLSGDDDRHWCARLICLLADTKRESARQSRTVWTGFKSLKHVDFNDVYVDKIQIREPRENDQ